MSTALVVADDSWVLNEVRSALAVGGWEIKHLPDPRQVTERLNETLFDVVIVDMQVGSMGGMAVVRDIRQGVEESERPRMVLLLDRHADEFLAKRAGADAAVLKPLNTASLRAAISPESVFVGADEEE